MQKEFYIDDVLVRRSVQWPNYACSKSGKVFRIDTGKRMSVHKGNPYMAFRSCHNNKARCVYLHVMIADCWLFNDDPLNKTEVNHKDGDKYHNHADNLEWVTKAQNQRHAVETGLKGKGSELYNSELTDDQVHEICKLIIDGQRVVDIANIYNVSSDIVRKIKSGSTYFHIRALYDIPHPYRKNFSESTVRWVCSQINKGISDADISKYSRNKSVSIIDIKHIRHKIRYTSISAEYF